MSDAEVLVNFLVQLCDTNTMKTIAAESLMMKIIDVERTFKERRLSSTASSSLQSTTHPSVDRMDSSSSFSSVLSSDSMDEIVNRTFLDFLMDFVTQFEFPQKIVTFLLHLLPDTEYKVHVHCTVNPLGSILKILYSPYHSLYISYGTTCSRENLSKFQDILSLVNTSFILVN